MSTTALRHDWTVAEVEALFALPFADLMFQAQATHRENHDPNAVQRATLLSVKTGACPEDCAYCPQSVRYDTGVEREALMDVETVVGRGGAGGGGGRAGGPVVARAGAPKAAGATRFCMGAAYRSPKQRDLDRINDMVRKVKALGLE